MSKEWRLVRLDELFDIGSSKRVMKSDWSESGVPFYRGREISTLASSGSVDNDLYISEELYASYAKKYGIPATGDLMMTAIGTVGNVWVVEADHRFYFKDASVLWLAKKTNCSSEFIKYWMKSQSFFDQLKLGAGATVDSLTIGRLSEVEVPLPPLDEQKRIVAKLDQALGYVDELGATTDSSLGEIDALWNRYLTEALNQTATQNQGTPVASEWSNVNLGDKLNLEYGKGLDSSLRNLDGAYPVYGAAGVKSYSGDYLVEGESIVIGRKGSAGQLTKVNGKFWPLDVTYYVQLKSNEVDIDYLFNWLDLRDLTKMAKGVKPGINRNEVYDLVMALPTLTEQKGIIAKLGAFKSDLDALRSIQISKRTESTTIRSSILSAAFAGDL